MSTLIRKSLALLAGGLVGMAFAAAPAQAISLGTDDPAEVAFKAGSFDGVNGHHPAGLFGAEYRFAQSFYGVRPMLGATVTTKGGAYGYAGFGIDISFGPHWVLTPNAAVGAFEKGDGTDLGSWCEFRTGAELDYHFADRSRLGFTFHHISNAGLTKRNPGEEELGIVYALPLQVIVP